MKQQFRRTALASLVMLMSATALVACGGGDDPAPAAPAAGGTGGGGSTDVVFATPASESTTTEGGSINGIGWNAGGTITASPVVAYSAGNKTVTKSITVTGSPTDGAAVLRLYAAGNATVPGDTATGTTFNASTYSNLKIQLQGLAAGTYKVALQPSPIDTGGCVFSAPITVADTAMHEYTVALNTTNFTAWCGTAVPFNTVKGALFAVEVQSQKVTAAGDYSITVGTVKFAP